VFHLRGITGCGINDPKRNITRNRRLRGLRGLDLEYLGIPIKHEGVLNDYSKVSNKFHR
jgi:hypothetical protein